MVIDLSGKSVRLREQRKLRRRIEYLRTQRAATAAQLESVAGAVAYAEHVLHTRFESAELCGRLMVRAMATAERVALPAPFFQLIDEFLVAATLPRPVETHYAERKVAIFADACRHSTGVAGIAAAVFTAGRLVDTYSERRIQAPHINILEMVAAEEGIKMATIFLRNDRRADVSLFTDSKVAGHILVKGRSKSPQLFEVFRRIERSWKEFPSSLRIMWIPSEKNIADAPSRRAAELAATDKSFWNTDQIDLAKAEEMGYLRRWG